MNFYKKLNEFVEYLEKAKGQLKTEAPVMATLKPKGVPSGIRTAKMAKVPKVPGFKQPDLKNPVKVANQIHNVDIKDQQLGEAQAALNIAPVSKEEGKMSEMLKYSPNGQWSLEKAHTSFKEMESAIARKHPEVKDPAAVAAAHAYKVYGKDKVQQYAQKGKSMEHAKPLKSAKKKDPEKKKSKPSREN